MAGLKNRKVRLPILYPAMLVILFQELLKVTPAPAETTVQHYLDILRKVTLSTVFLQSFCDKFKSGFLRRLLLFLNDSGLTFILLIFMV